MVADFVQTLRALRRAPWYSVTIIGVIALGMTLATTVFAIVDGVLFRPMPYPDRDRLFAIKPGFAGIPSPGTRGASDAEIASWVAAAPDVAFTAFRSQPHGGFGTGVNDDAAGVARVQSNVFEVLGVRPWIGGFAKEDFEQSTLMLPVVITYDLWQGRYQADPAVIGRTVEIDPLNHYGFRVVGVMPRGFTFPSEQTEVKFLAPAEPASAWPDPFNRRFYGMIARVPASMGAVALRERVEAGLRATAAVFPARGTKPPGWSDQAWRTQGPYDQAEVEPLSTHVGSRTRPLFRAVFFAVALLVGLSALNVSGLMAARTLDRARELGVRRVLGASPAAVARLVFAEALTLIFAAALVGFAFAQPLLRFALSLLPDEIVLLKPATIDWRVAAFVSLSAVLLSIPTAVWPIRRAVRSGVPASGSERTSARTRTTGRFIVIASQVAGALVLIVTGALLVGSILAVYANGHPIHTDDVVVIAGRMSGPGAGGMLRPDPGRPARVAPMLDRLRQLPGVVAVGVTSAELLDGGYGQSRFARPPGAANPKLNVDVLAVTPDYYRVIRPQVVAGRLPTDAELAANARVVLVSEAVARGYWPNAPAVGQTMTEAADPEPFVVVGVVRDVRWFSWDTEVASIYGPYALLSRTPMLTFMIQTNGQTDRVLADGLQALRNVDRLVFLSRAATLEALFVDSVRLRRFRSWLFGSLAAAGLVVVGVGILGLIAMSTARRTKEIGIRHALGATRARIVSLLVREQMKPVVAGLVVGSLIAAWAVTFVSSYLYGITVSDPRVWIAAVALIVGTAVVGALAPAVRASGTDPVRALRVE